MSTFFLNPNADNEAIIRNIGKTIRALDTGKRWEISIRLFKRSRSRDQNAYYWSTVLPTIKAWYFESRGTAVTEEVLHEELKPLYVPFATALSTTGEQVRLYRSTTKLTTAEFNTMIDQIREEFAEMGCHIPPPDPDWKKNVRKKQEQAA